jgi:hypothetical protein
LCQLPVVSSKPSVGLDERFHQGQTANNPTQHVKQLLDTRGENGRMARTGG